MSARALAASVLAAVLLLCPTAKAAGPPQILDSWVEHVSATGADLHLELIPNGLSTTYRFEYIPEAAYRANTEAIPPRPGFFGAAKAPPGSPAGVGSGFGAVAGTQHLGSLTPASAYRYRAVATNSAETVTGPERVFATQDASSLFHLPDARAWEMVSPIDKGGGAIASPQGLFGGGEFQAAAGGSAITYGSASAFGQAKGAPPSSQYLSRRSSAGWSTENLSTPLESAAYGDKPDGAPYRLFSTDLSKALLFGGLACRGALPGCPAPNPVLPGSGAPAGFMAYYLREGSTGSFTSLLSGADLAHTAVSPEAFEVSFTAASADLSHILLSSCAALSAAASEVLSAPGKCDPNAQNLYLRSASGLSLVNPSPGPPGAQIAAPIGAVSESAARLYWAQGGDLHLREGTQSRLVDKAEGGSFQAASADGSIAFFTREGHLYRFSALSDVSTDLTPGGGVVGVLGASEEGSSVFYQDGSGIERWREGTITQVAPGAGAALPSDYEPPTAGTSRLSPDGEHLAFLSNKELAAYDNAGQSEVYLWGPIGAGAPQLICASCNPSGERAQGAASIPGALINGSTLAYRPRALSANGNRLFFDSNAKLAIQDTNQHPDVYQWEAKGEGDCTRSPGCLSLISSGRAPEGAIFIDASADGSDAYFTTDGSLVGADPGSIDLYDARIGGGFPEAPKPIPCIADACQSLPASPEDPDPGTLVKNQGNPPLHLDKEKKKKHKRKKQQGKKHKGKGKRHNGEGQFHVSLRDLLSLSISFELYFPF